jgi:hypothetical protein
MRIPLEQARAGDVLVFNRAGLLALILSWVIQKLKEPKWDREDWHMGFVVSDYEYADAQFPKVKLSLLKDIKRPAKVYRLCEDCPKQSDIDEFVYDHIGKPYDFMVYFWTCLWALGIPVPRLVNRFYMCWEIAWDGLEYCGIDIDKSDRKYPFITDFLKYVGEL